MKLISLLILFNCLIIQSCSESYEISQESNNWQPYSIGDILVFESSKNEKDTIFIKAIDSYTNPSDPLDAFPDYYESLFITGNISLIKPYKSSIGKIVSKEHTNILKLTANENDYIKFEFSKKEAKYYGNTSFSISSLEERKPIEYGNYNDILFFENIEGDYYHRDNYIIRLFWSKKFGYVRYELKDDYYWNLKEFVRNGKNILNN